MNADGVTLNRTSSMRTTWSTTLAAGMSLFLVVESSTAQSWPTDLHAIPAIQAFLGGAAFGDAHRDAPPETRQFGQLAGLWEAEQEVRRTDGSWVTVAPGLWAWKYSLDGFAVNDLWYQGEDRLPSYLGDLGRDYLLTATRVFDARAGKWRVAWASNGAGQTPGSDFGTFDGIYEDGRLIMTSPPLEGVGLQRIVFSNLSHDSFQWQSEFSPDNGKTWNVVMRIRARRHE